METDESGCKIIMPLFDFQNKNKVEYSFLEGQQKNGDAVRFLS